MCCVYLENTWSFFAAESEDGEKEYRVRNQSCPNITDLAFRDADCVDKPTCSDLEISNMSVNSTNTSNLGAHSSSTATIALGIYNIIFYYDILYFI